MTTAQIRERGPEPIRALARAFGQLRGGAERYAIVARWHTQAGPSGHPRTPDPQTRRGETS
jgi:hypothetical protein